jgi:hypothetical protein
MARADRRHAVCWAHRRCLATILIAAMRRIPMSTATTASVRSRPSSAVAHFARRAAALRCRCGSATHRHGLGDLHAYAGLESWTGPGERHSIVDVCGLLHEVASKHLLGGIATLLGRESLDLTDATANINDARTELSDPRAPQAASAPGAASRLGSPRKASTYFGIVPAPLCRRRSPARMPDGQAHPESTEAPQNSQRMLWVDGRRARRRPGVERPADGPRGMSGSAG